MNEPMSTGRMEAFSDGVFAIAITLLILNIAVPNAAPGRLGDRLSEQWPSYVAYFGSFFLIGIYWVNHHAYMQRLRGTDRTLLFVNLVFLMTISVLPFPTALLARYMQAGHDERLAAVVYGAAGLATAVSFASIWLYAARDRRLLRGDATPGRIASLTVLAGPVSYLLAIGLALISPVAALIVYAVMPLAYISAERGLGA